MDKNIDLFDYFNTEFIEDNKISGIYKKQKLYSKKNRVNKVEIAFSNSSKKTYVLKEYIGSDRISRGDNESFFYDILKGSDLNTPAIFYRKEALLVMEFLGDDTLLDYITAEEQESKRISLEDCSDPESLKDRYSPLADACIYIHDFNKTLQKRYGRSFVFNDMNLRNFLIPGNRMYRVDFEDCREGLIEEDIGKFVAFLLTYKPAFTYWKLCISECIKKYCTDILSLDKDRINLQMDKEFERMKKRRTRQ